MDGAEVKRVNKSKRVNLTFESQSMDKLWTVGKLAANEFP